MPSTPEPFLSDETLERALAILDGMRRDYSIDAHYEQMDLGPDAVAEAIRDDAVRAAGDLSLLPRDGWLPIWREIVAPGDWDHAAEAKPHLHWSHDPELAHAHWGEGEGVRWLLRGRVRIEEVDEAATIASNANPSLAHEGEVKLLQGAAPIVEDASRRPEGHRHPVL